MNPAKQAAAPASCRLRRRWLSSFALLVSLMLLLPTTAAASSSPSSATTMDHLPPPFTAAGAEAVAIAAASAKDRGGETEDARVRCCRFDGTTTRRRCSGRPSSVGGRAVQATLSTPRGGGVAPSTTSKSKSVAAAAAAASKSSTTKSKTSSSRLLLPAWFRPNQSQRERQLSAALLVWNALAIVDAIRFTFCPQDNLRGYFVEAHANNLSSQVIVMTRFLANCQWAYLATSVLVALTASNEVVLKSAFGIAIGATIGAFRAVALGIEDGVILKPWKSKYASLLTLPPLLLLAYFAFVF